MRQLNLTNAILIAGLTLGGAAYAQTAAEQTPAPAPAAPAPEATPEAAPAPAPMDAPAATAPTTIGAPEGYNPVEFGTITAEELKGVDVYDSTGASVGDVADLVIAADGKVSGVILDVGGFLGIGSHSVLLGPDAISFYRNADNDLRGQVSSSKEALKEMPAYSRP